MVLYHYKTIILPLYKGELPYDVRKDPISLSQKG